MRSFFLKFHRNSSLQKPFNMIPEGEKGEKLMTVNLVAHHP